MEIAVGAARARGGEVSCTFCRTSIGAAEPLVLCPGCGATLHEPCRRELSRCPTPGCEQLPGRPRSTPEPEARPRGERRAVRILEPEELAALAARERAREGTGELAIKLLFGLPLLLCVGSIGLVTLLEGTRGVVIAGVVGLAFTLAAARDLWRERARRDLPPALRVLMLVLGPAAMGFAAGAALGLGYVGVALGVVLGLAVSIADAAR